jgi:hypothetical protein
MSDRGQAARAFKYFLEVLLQNLRKIRCYDPTERYLLRAIVKKI